MKLFFLLFALSFLFTLHSQEVVYIPSHAFKMQLLSNANINTNGDDEIQVSEAENYYGTISCCTQEYGSLNDATGIQSFVNIDAIAFSNENLHSIDLSQNVMLGVLVLPSNQITELNLQNNIELERLDLTYNLIEEIDLSNNINLIRSLDLKNNPNLLQVNLQNGRNGDAILYTLRNNPNLTCVQIDPGFVVPYPSGSAGWWYDDYSVFSENCYQEDLATQENKLNPKEVQMYPNPATDVLNIKSPIIINKILVYDMTGKVVKTVQNQEQVALGDLPNATYLVQIETDKGKATQKIFKE